MDKYADEGIENIEDVAILKVNPFGGFGTPTAIVNLFGGVVEYQRALVALESEIYRVA